MMVLLEKVFYLSPSFFLFVACSICGKSFNNSTQLSCHKRVGHKLRAAREAASASEGPAGPTCRDGRKRSKSHHDFLVELVQEFKVNYVSSQESSCGFCGKVFQGQEKRRGNSGEVCTVEQRELANLLKRDKGIYIYNSVKEKIEAHSFRSNGECFLKEERCQSLADVFLHTSHSIYVESNLVLFQSLLRMSHHLFS